MATSRSVPSTPSRNRVRPVHPSSPPTPSRTVLLEEFRQREREISSTNTNLIRAQLALEEAEELRVRAQQNLDLTFEGLSRRMQEMNLTYNALSQSFAGLPASLQPAAGFQSATPPASPSVAPRNSSSMAPPASPTPAPRLAVPSDLTVVGRTQPSANPGRGNFPAYIVYSGSNGGHGRFDTWEEAEALCTGSSYVLKGFLDPRLADELYDEFCQSDLGEIFRQPPQTGELIVVISGVKPGVYKSRAFAVIYGVQYGGGEARRVLCGPPEAWALFRAWKQMGAVKQTAGRDPQLFN
ncbi:hypothetical protein PM082_019906 [Marasmius tenuissimus]|nr:hypothetical protein PM082_019906 [Marasmius tenuissimus]